MGVLDQLCPRLSRPVIRLPQQIGDIRCVQRQPILMFCHARTVLNHTCHGFVAAMQQLLFVHQAGDELGVQELALVGTHHLVFKVCGDPKQLSELGVVFLQQHPGFPIAKQYDLYVQRNGFGFQ